jgi:hypothetical protein
MNVLIFILNYWDVILSILLIVIGTIVKLKNLWRGNFIEWLIAICDEMEKEFGAGMGLLKHANAYAKFVDKYPVISKFISQATFDKWVKEALDILEHKCTCYNYKYREVYQFQDKIIEFNKMFLSKPAFGLIEIEFNSEEEAADFDYKLILGNEVTEVTGKDEYYNRNISFPLDNLFFEKVKKTLIKND